MAANRPFSVRWLIVAMLTLAGASGIALVASFWFSQEMTVLGLLAVGSGLSALLLGRVADENVVGEIGVAAAVVAGSLFAADGVVPELDFIDVPGRPLVWVAVFATTMFAFATMGGRSGARLRSRLGDGNWVGKSFVFSFMLHGVGCAWIFALALAHRFHLHDIAAAIQLAGLLIPVAAGLILQMAYREPLRPLVFLLGAFLAAVPTTTLALAVGGDMAEKITICCGAVIIGFAFSLCGAKFGGLFRPTERAAPVPTARAR